MKVRVNEFGAYELVGDVIERIKEARKSAQLIEVFALMHSYIDWLMIAVIYNYVARKQSSIEAITEYGFKIHQKEGRFEIKEGEEDCVLYPSSTKLMKFLKQEKLASGRVYRSYTKFSKRRNWAIHNLVSYSMLPNMQDKRTKKNLRVYPKDVETAYKQGDYVMEQLGLETERLSSNQKTGFLSYQKQEPRKSDEILPKPNLPPVCSAP